MSFFDNITKMFNKKESDKVLGIDIGSSSIKLVQLSRKKGIAVLDTFGEISLSIYSGKKIGQPVSLSTDKLTEALSDVIKESQASANDAAFAIPLKSTLMFNLKIPRTVEKVKLGDMIKIEARKYIPVPITEVQMDWSILPTFNVAEQPQKKEDENYEILVVAIHKETLGKYGKIASSIGLNVNFLEVETFSVIRSLVKYQKDTVAIVDIGASITKLYVIELGIIRKSYIINIGSSRMTDYLNTNQVIKKKDIAGEAASLMREMNQGYKSPGDTPTDLVRIVNEVQKNLLSYQKNNNKNVPALILTGGGILSEKVKDYFKEKMSLEVKIGDPFSRVENPAFLDNALKTAGATFSVAVGIALRGLK